MLVLMIDAFPSVVEVDDKGQKSLRPVSVYAQADMPEIPGIGCAKEVIPVTTFKETMARVLLSVIEFPQCFCLFNIPDDKVVAVDVLASQNGVVFADEACAAYKKRFFVKKEDLDNTPMVFGDVHAMYEFLHGENVFSDMLRAGFLKQTAPPTFVEDVRSLCQAVKVEDVEGLKKMMPVEGVSDYELEVAIGWAVYAVTMVPMMLWDLCSDTGGVHRDGYRTMNLEMMGAMVSKTWPVLKVIQAQIIPWVMDGQKEEPYARIFQSMENAITDNVKVLSVWTQNKEIADDDECPCGSHKSYCECHGALLTK